MRKVRYRGVVDYENTHLKMRQLLESMKLVAEDANFTRQERREVGYLAQSLLHRAQYLLLDADKESENEQDLLMDIVEVTPGDVDKGVDERSWAEHIRDVAGSLEDLLREEKSFVEERCYLAEHSEEVPPTEGKKPAFEDAPEFLRELAEIWEKKHPLEECPVCSGKGYKSKSAIKCGPCLGSGKVRVGTVDVPVKVTVKDEGPTREEVIEDVRACFEFWKR